jgi:hypothetical protein
LSGPKSVIVTVDPVTVVLAAAAATAASAVARLQAARADAARLRQMHADQREERAAAAADATARRLAAIAGEADEAESRVAQLLGLLRRTGTDEGSVPGLPARPEAADPELLAAYLDGLQEAAGGLQALLLARAASLRETLAGEPEGFAVPGTPTPAASLSRGQRLLARIAPLGPVPGELAELATELDAAGDTQRAELLATELRRRIQAHAEAIREGQLLAATGVVVDQALRDLGYQVDEIGETLFVDGGTVHFRKPGWGDYQVRMRVSAGGRAANFNVVKAVDSADAERGVLDHLAEDRWCAEFPALLRALEARGVHLDVTRHLGAGELPVQHVARDALPAFPENEADAAPARVPRQRELP